MPRASKLLICGLFQKVRVLAQDGLRHSYFHRKRDGSPSAAPWVFRAGKLVRLRLRPSVPVWYTLVEVRKKSLVSRRELRISGTAEVTALGANALMRP